MWPTSTQVEAPAAAAYERFGAVHVVCNNAGVVTRGAHGLPPTALPAETIAAMVVDAITTDRFWIVSHDGYHEGITRRTTAC